MAKLGYDAFALKIRSVYSNMTLTDGHLRVVYQFYLDSDQAIIDDTMAWYKTVFVQD